MTDKTKLRVKRAYRAAMDKVAERLGDEVAADIEDFPIYLEDREHRLRAQNRKMKEMLGLDPEAEV